MRLVKQEKTKITTAICLFFAFITICFIFDQFLDGYFLWLCVDQGFLTVFWQKNRLYTIPLPFNPRSPLWIPLVPLAIVIAYLVEAKRSLNFNVYFRGRRIHHYHVGLLSIGLATLLAIISLNNGGFSASIWLGWKRTSIAEILQGLSFTFIIGGITLILLDTRDLSSALTNHFRKN
jgi:hypothetical protein